MRVYSTRYARDRDYSSLNNCANQRHHHCTNTTKPIVNDSGHFLPQYHKNKTSQPRPLWDYPVTQHDIDRACLCCRKGQRHCKYCMYWDDDFILSESSFNFFNFQ
jgi:hypothetical protein